MISPLETIVGAQKKLLRKPITSDITIKCGDRTWRCQSAILSQRCEFFRVATVGGFKEAELRTITLNDDDAEGVDLMLVYLYTLEVSKLFDITTAEMCFTLGDKYDLQVFRTAGYEHLLSRLDWTIWSLQDESAKTLFVAFLYQLWTWNMKDSDDLRAAVVQNFSRLGRALIEYEPFQKLLEVNAAFSLALVRALLKATG
ncbi:hypothetical protein LTR70_001984 [Exophiala xenobiotica]|uniref:BTB domain-containing protein n=1 Tax=Lithohypha guttulata TaxID=1690604 RepID=A0ABR0JX34_9EURO|nr:hypothetical protein LTR24_009407 [Lithohypha guttulata]KAK5326969.1 hypothetical protein LTR70_001984 [Exophiala xenobiotica]